MNKRQLIAPALAAPLALTMTARMSTTSHAQSNVPFSVVQVASDPGLCIIYYSTTYYQRGYYSFQHGYYDDCSDTGYDISYFLSHGNFPYD